MRIINGRQMVENLNNYFLCYIDMTLRDIRYMIKINSMILVCAKVLEKEIVLVIFC